MRSKFAVLGVCAACLLMGDPVVKTTNFDFPANGTLRLQNSTGEVTIEGWDQPGVEITTTTNGKEEDRVKVSTNRNGGELVVTTEYPHHRAFPWVTPLQTVTNFDLAYVIKVPRTAKLIVRHGDGGVHIDDVAGDIQVTARQGLISLRLTGEMPRAIDAKSDLGSVNSDFAGNESRHPWPFGHTFVEGTSAPQNVHLKIGFGDIVILKAHEPKAPSPVS